MKKIIVFALALLLAAALASPLRLPVLAEAGIAADPGFSAEEIPEFGNSEEVFFPEEGVPTPDPIAAGEERLPEEAPEADPESDNLSENQPITNSGLESRTEERESVDQVDSPSPAPVPTSHNPTNLLVILAVSVVAVGTLAFGLSRKRKSAKHGKTD